MRNMIASLLAGFLGCALCLTLAAKGAGYVIWQTILFDTEDPEIRAYYDGEGSVTTAGEFKIKSGVQHSLGNDDSMCFYNDLAGTPIQLGCFETDGDMKILQAGAPGLEYVAVISDTYVERVSSLPTPVAGISPWVIVNPGTGGDCLYLGGYNGTSWVYVQMWCL